MERTGLIKFAGREMTVVGQDVTAGAAALEFIVQSQDWSSFPLLESTRGKIRIIAAVPSLDTSVCDRETRRFNLEAAALDESIRIIVISTDLPVAQKRWCGAAGVDQVMVVSDHMAAEFGEKYGCLMKEVRLLRRAIFIVDASDRVSYVAYMPTNGDEPDYPAVLAAARQLVTA